MFINIDLQSGHKKPELAGHYLCWMQVMGELGLSHYWAILSWGHSAAEGDSWNREGQEPGAQVVWWGEIPRDFEQKTMTPRVLDYLTKILHVISEATDEISQPEMRQLLELSIKDFKGFLQ